MVGRRPWLRAFRWAGHARDQRRLGQGVGARVLAAVVGVVVLVALCTIGRERRVWSAGDGLFAEGRSLSPFL